MSPGHVKIRGFTLLPVMLTMGLIAAVAFTLNRDNGINAAMVSNQLDADRARYAAEAGLQAVNAAVQADSCGGGFPVAGTPVVNSSFGGASYSAYATSSSGNTTGLVSTGVFNGTSVTLTRSNVYVYQTTAKTYTLQPNAAAGMDTYIDSSTESNFGATDSLSIRKNQQSLLFRFDLAAFPAGSRPVSATLSAYASGGLLGGVDFYRMTSPWVEGSGANSPLDGATWNTSNGSTAWTPGGPAHPVKLNATTKVLAGSLWVNFDATQVATAWLEGRYPNHGVLIKSTGELGSYKFTSSDDSSAADRPKITFSYLLPCGTTGPEDTPSGTLTLNASADSFNDSGAAVANNGAATSLSVYYTPTHETRIPISFDVRAVPAGAVVKSAVLRLYVSGVASATANSKSLWVNAIGDSWAEGAGKNANKTCPTATAGTAWNFSTNCTNWTTIHPPNTAPAWTTLASMPTARTGHVVVAVNNKIYAIGGLNGSGYLNKVEEYDPAANTWTAKASMPTRRAEAAAAVLNGKIYVIGGTDGGTLDKNEEYDPVANVWTSRKVLPSGRKYLSAVAMGGKIYAIGGATNTAAVKTSEAYDPATNTWTTRASMLTARMWFAGQGVGGKIYALGGYAGATSISNAEVYDPSANSWAARAALPIATDSMASAVLGNRIYLIAGFQGAATTKAVAAYDTLHNAYTTLLNYPMASNEPAAAVVSDRIFSMGGDNNATTYYANHYQFDPGIATPLATAVDESSSDSPLAAGFGSGWITFDLTALAQEWVDGIRPNNGIVVYAEGADQFSINSREASSRTPQLVVTY
jgi:N-acetylneuraminic acid mutarotase/Tfp pilus assembly protein PilX